MIENTPSCESEGIPEETWEVTAEVWGSSMKPLLRPKGDHVRIVPLQRDLVIGDIIVFPRDDGKLIMHRVFKLTDTYIQTIGDNRENPDREIPYDAVFGLVTHIQRGKRTIYVDNSRWQFIGRMLTRTRPARLFLFKHVKQPLWRLGKRILNK